MSHSDQITYIANVIAISQADGKVTEKEQNAIAFVCQKNGLSEDDAQTATHLVQAGDYNITPVGRYSDTIRNLEDMLLVSLIDGDLANKEKKAMLAFAKVVKLSQEQINTIVSETKKFVRAMTAETKCNACGVSLPAGSKFCTECGQKIQT
jgi:uncharacterized tellurite resistance protein B-like protein